MRSLPEIWGERIRQARLAAGLTQTALAAAAGVRQSTIGRWEDGTYSPRDDRRPAVARALGVTVADLFSYDVNGGEGEAA